MAVTVSGAQTKVKLVRTVDNPDGSVKRSTATFSNLVASPENDAIVTGFKAMYTLMKTAPDELHRVDEVTLTEA